jgi:hypothetical protein
MSLSIDKKLFGGFGALFLAFITLALGAWILSGRLNDRVSELANVSGRSLQLAERCIFRRQHQGGPAAGHHPVGEAG